LLNAVITFLNRNLREMVEVKSEGRVPRQKRKRTRIWRKTKEVKGSVENPDPDPYDPYVFGPPGSRCGSVNKRYRSGSESGYFYHQAEIVRKTLIPAVL
jgi:hypothetical protein